MWPYIIAFIIIIALLWLRHQFINAPLVDENDNIIEVNE